MQYVVIVLNLLVLIFLLLFIITSVASFIKGAVFVPSTKNKVQKILKLANIKPGMKMADLGSGDGRIIIAMAEKGAIAHGFEINPFLVLWSKYLINKRKLNKNAFIHWKNFWSENYSSYDVIVVYGIFYIMEDLEKKLQKELKKKSKVISNGFPFPNWKYDILDSAVYTYTQK